MNLGMVLAAIIVPIICGIIATFIVTRVQTVHAQRREQSSINTEQDSDL